MSLLKKIAKILPEKISYRYGVYCGTNRFNEFLIALKYLLTFDSKLKAKKDIKNFEKKFSKISNYKYAISYGSGRMALFSILKALNIKSKDEVILPAFTCSVVPNAIIYAGATPVYVDIETNNFNIDTNLIEKKITKKTKAIYAQHTFGIKCDLKKIEKIAKNYNLKIIEDSAHYFDLKKKQKGKGNINYYSLDHSKVINTHLGGVATTDDRNLHEKLLKNSKNNHELSYFLKVKIIISFILEYILFNRYILWIGRSIQIVLNYFNLIFYFKDELKLKKPYYYPCNLTGFQAHVGVSQLKNIKNNLKHRLIIANNLQKKIKWYNLSKNDFNNSTWLRYSFLVKDQKKFEKRFHSIFNLDIWYKNLFEGRDKDLHEIKYKKKSCPKAEYVSKHIVNLPTHIKIPQKMINKFVDKNWIWLKNEIDYKFKKIK